MAQRLVHRFFEWVNGQNPLWVLIGCLLIIVLFWGSVILLLVL